MKKFLLTLLVTLTLSSCALQQEVQPPQASTPIEPSNPPSFDDTQHSASLIRPDPLYFSSKEELHNAIIEAREAFEENKIVGAMGTLEEDNGTYHKLEEVAGYVDFNNLVDEVEFFEIYVSKSYLDLEYCGKDKQDGVLLSVGNFKSVGIFDNEEHYLEIVRTMFIKDPIELNYNGKTIIKAEVYSAGVYSHNCYYWEENGYYVQLMVSDTLLALYPEETFFEVQVVEVPAGMASE